jgi:hypothetical protein
MSGSWQNNRRNGFTGYNNKRSENSWRGNNSNFPAYSFEDRTLLSELLAERRTKNQQDRQAKYFTEHFEYQQMRSNGITHDVAFGKILAKRESENTSSSDFFQKMKRELSAQLNVNPTTTATTPTIATTTTGDTTTNGDTAMQVTPDTTAALQQQLNQTDSQLQKLTSTTDHRMTQMEGRLTSLENSAYRVETLLNAIATKNGIQINN